MGFMKRLKAPLHLMGVCVLMLAVLPPAARGSGAVEASGAQDDPPPTVEGNDEWAPVDPLAEGLIDAPEAGAQTPTRTLIANLGAEATGVGAGATLADGSGS